MDQISILAICFNYLPLLKYYLFLKLKIFIKMPEFTKSKEDLGVFWKYLNRVSYLQELIAKIIGQI